MKKCELTMRYFKRRKATKLRKTKSGSVGE